MASRWYSRACVILNTNNHEGVLLLLFLRYNGKEEPARSKRLARIYVTYEQISAKIHFSWSLFSCANKIKAMKTGVQFEERFI